MGLEKLTDPVHLSMGKCKTRMDHIPSMTKTSLGVHNNLSKSKGRNEIQNEMETYTHLTMYNLSIYWIEKKELPQTFSNYVTIITLFTQNYMLQVFPLNLPEPELEARACL